MNYQQAINLLQAFPEELKREVIHFIEFLSQKKPIQPVEQESKSYPILNEDPNQDIQHLLKEPTYTEISLESNYTFHWNSIEGKWPGDESAKEIIQVYQKEVE